VKRDIATTCGISYEAVRQWYAGDTGNIKNDNLVALADGYDTTVDWLLSGKGDPPRRKLASAPSDSKAGADGSPSSSAELVLEMLSKAGKLTPEGRQAILSAVDEVSDKPAASNVITGDFSRPGPVGDEIRIAHYDVQGAMGNGKLVQDYPEMFRDVTVSQKQLRDLGVTYKDPSHLKIISGDGQSMSPIIQHLDPMISDVSIREYTGDGIYAFTWQGHFYIKSLQIADEDHFLMVSANETLYPPKKIRIDDTYIQARILLVWKATRV